MARKAKDLSAIGVARLTEPGMHFVGEVPGLALQVLPTGGRTWILRVVVGGKRRDMGLGGYPAVTLAQAREAARAARAKVKAGIDPIEEARASQSALRASYASAVSFEVCAERYISAQSPTWKNAKSEQQWRNTLAAYAFPVMGSLLVRDVAMSHVLDVLEPIWRTKTETASRLRGRIESVLDWATVSGFRSGLNPARWKGHLDKVLPAAGKIAKTEHFAALPVSDMGEFMIALRNASGVGARALEFAILTAARSGEARGAVWEEFDLQASVWTIPAERMKMKKAHRVPLSQEAKALIESQPKRAESPYVFAAPRGGMLSDMTLTAVLRRIGAPAVPHGFRSTFKDWASEYTNYPRDVSEMALAHSIGDKVEAAYRRGELFLKRTRLMADWAAFCAQVEAKGEVIPMNRQA
jgi:integrase